MRANLQMCHRRALVTPEHAKKPHPTGGAVVSDQAQLLSVAALAVTYFIWELKRVKRRLTTIEDRLDVAHHRNFKARILINKLLMYIRSFCSSAYEIMENSRDTQVPITDKQIQRLKGVGSVDSILKEEKWNEGNK